MYPMTRLALGSMLAIVAGAGPASADVMFSDNTFNLGNYSPSPNFASDPSASIVYANPVSPANTLQFTADYTAPGNPPTYVVALGLANTTFEYDPSTQGAINSIDASVLKNVITGFAGTGFSNTFHPTILQDGVYYVASIAGATFDGPNVPGGTGFNLFSQSDLLASAFVAYDFTTGTFGSANPNFDGDPILLGLTQITTVTSTATGTFVTQFQNLDFDIHGVPEPATLALLGVGLAGLGFARRKQ